MDSNVLMYVLGVALIIILLVAIWAEDKYFWGKYVNKVRK